jgi:hypothetical protein
MATPARCEKNGRLRLARVYRAYSRDTSSEFVVQEAHFIVLIPNN